MTYKNQYKRMAALNNDTPTFVLPCIDKRFSNFINEYLNARFPRKDSFTNYFYGTAAGAGLSLAYNNYTKNNGLKCNCGNQKSMKIIRRSILENISISQKLNNVNTLYILNHQDCGAVRVFLECPQTNNSRNVKNKYPIDHGLHSNCISDSRNPMISSNAQRACDICNNLNGRNYYECLVKCLNINVSNSSINNFKLNNLPNSRIKEILVEINTHQKLLREALIYIKKRNKSITNVIIGLIDKDGTVADYNAENNQWKITYISPTQIQNPNTNQRGLWSLFT